LSSCCALLSQTNRESAAEGLAELFAETRVSMPHVLLMQLQSIQADMCGMWNTHLDAPQLVRGECVACEGTVVPALALLCCVHSQQSQQMNQQSLRIHQYATCR
jgi:hypothetical protein